MENRKRIYISGQVSGLSRNTYYENFALAELSIAFRGNIPLNPVKLCEEAGLERYSDCMLLCIQSLKNSDGCYFLKNWKCSSGAKIEREFVDLLQQLNPVYELFFETED